MTAADLFSTHRETLDAAVAATRSRDFYSAYNESPSPRVYGETAAADGVAAFEAWRGTTFEPMTRGHPAQPNSSIGSAIATS